MNFSKKIGMTLELSRKALHKVLREARFPPELRHARRISRWSIHQGQSVDLHHDVKPLSSAAPPQRILIWSLRDWSVHVQTEALIGQSLRARGARVSFASCGGGLDICDRVNTWEGPPMPCRSCTKYVSTSLKAHKFDTIYLRDEWSEHDWPELDSLNYRDLRTLEWNGLPLGRIVEIPTRWFLLGESIEADPLGVTTFRNFLRSARKIAEAAEKILDKESPDQVILLNGLFLFEAIVIELCQQRNISYVTYERALILDSFVFARDDVCALYRDDEAWDAVKHKPLKRSELRELNRHVADRRVGKEQSDNYWEAVRKDSIFSPNARVRAVLFTNLVWDSAVIGQDLAFGSIVEWLESVIKKFSSLPEAELVIRIHPAEAKLKGRETREQMKVALRQRIPLLPENIQIIPPDDPLDSYSLMEDADFGLVYSSTTGLEMSLLGKPVIVAAHTHYRGKGFTIDVANEQELWSQIDTQVTPRSLFIPDVELAERYAHFVFFKSTYREIGITEPIRGLCTLDSRAIQRSVDSGEGDLSRLIDTILDRSHFGCPRS